MEKLPLSEAPFMALIDAAVAQIVATEDSDAFHAWMRDPDRLAEIVPERDHDAERVIATSLTRLIWNATPLPCNRFRPRPLPKPERNAPCPCGSGQKFKRCCATLPPMPELDSEEIWQIAASHLSTPQLEQALNQNAIPPSALAEFAARLLDEGRSGRAVRLLESLFAGSLGRLDGRHEPALDLLCDAYDARGHHRKKRTLLERVIREARLELRSAAWQRLATILMDDGEPAAAWHAFREAQRADPEHPALAALEVTLLMGEGRSSEAGDRARFWRKRLEHSEFTTPEMLAFLDQVAADPGGALLLPADDDLTPRLLACLERADSRPLPHYAIVTESDGGDAAPAADALRKRLRAMGIDAGEIERVLTEMQNQLEDDPDEAFEPGEAPQLEVIEPPSAVTRLEARWREIYPGAKPFSVQLEPLGEEDVWDPDTTEEWVAFLEREPAAFDSLDVLDDLACALFIHPALGLPGMEQRFCAPLLERAVAILDQALAGHQRPANLAWVCVENRPVLRLLFRYALWLERADRGDASQQRYRQMLAINPNDNHGIRAIVVNALLRVGQDHDALAICEDYPDDMHVETAFGAVLARYRLGDQEGAHQALELAQSLNPHVIPMLAKERVRRPKIDPRAIQLGGKDQAWIYRDEMRDVWQGVPGLLEWIKRR